MSGRKRKSLWDCKEETEVPSEFSTHNARYGRGIHSNHRALRSDLEANNALNSNNCLRQSSSQTWQDNNDHMDFHEIPETARTISRVKGYSQSPVFNGRGRQNHSPSQETSWSQSHRYQRSSRSGSQSRGRARSRSRSRDMDEDKDYNRRRDFDVDEDRNYTRSRDRDMDEDREYNRSRDRDMDEDRNYIRRRGRGRDIDDASDYPRSWERERERERERNNDMDEGRDFMRSRGRDKDINNDSARSRSTLYDHRRVDGAGDRKSGSRAPSQLCRDFAVGNCRRGSQCRFLHEEEIKLRDGGELARERAEKWRDRQEAGEALSADIERLRYNPANKVSNYDRSNRSTSFDHDHMRRPNQPYKKGNIPCKYFAMGRCHRDDCRFSHDQSEGGSVEGRLHYDKYAQHMGNENKYRNGPEWGDGNVVSNVNNTKWSDNDVRTVNSSDRTTSKKQTFDSLDQNMNHEDRLWSGLGSGDINGVSDLPTRWVERNSESMDFSEPASVEIKTDERHGNNLDYMMQNTTGNGRNISNVENFELTGRSSLFGREAWHDAQGSHFESQNGRPLQTYEHIIEKAPTQQHINNVAHPVVSESFNVQMHLGKRGNNDMLADDSSALNGVGISESTIQLDIHSQRFGQKSESLSSLPFSYVDTSQRNMIPRDSSKGDGIDPNGSDKQPLYLSEQSEPMIFSEESTKKQQVCEYKEPQADSSIHQSLHQNDMTSYQVAEMTNLSASLNEILSKGQQLPQLYAALNPNNSSLLLSSLSSSAIVSSPIGSIAGQPNPTTMFKEQYVHIGDTMGPGTYDRRGKPYELGKPDSLASVPSSIEEPSKHDSNSKPSELDKAMTSEHLFPLSNDGISEHGNNKPYELHEPIQLKPHTNSESQQSLGTKAEKCKPEEVPVANANAEGDVREGNCVKDEKEMRLFKVALVEYVKDILKPTWKEGQMSRDVHKTIVKKVVDKVTNTIQGGHVPKTQEKIDQYLSCSKGKLTKLVQAYTERLSKS